MSHPAPPIARRLACLAVLLGALAILLPAALAPGASAADGRVPASPTITGPSPSPSVTPATPTPAPPSAQVALTRAACDSVHLTARTDSTAPLTYRVADEAGNVVATGTFSGSVDRILSLSTGHDYTATVTGAGTGPLATSSPASLRDACPVSITADAPGFDDPCGTQADAVVAPTIIGVDYRVGGTVLAPGANAAVGMVTVEAVARPGYVLKGTSQWTHTFSATPCAGSAEAPTAPQEDAPAAVQPPAAPPAAPAPGTSAAAGPSAGLAAQPTSAPTPGLDDSATRSAAQPAMQASVGGPGPLEWSIMIAIALAGGIAFWLKTRH
ncbi:hypothetical protein SA2016_0651 [Sinomonas atrocyanea]|uniref:Fibronectin type-III domain-containing protein n=1 Tax=Sinomonas atrocyanea TaxID=37927 RepID=A0A126ZXP7_9MICC|nr:hypothetical protein SA2016_0651 [Sinomonas atrocyanea]GEB64430.1 hypothetical protein SAT01_18780 [Sinomonas atrocyanea]GGG62943.1 hypothetical protein GCM10007172_12680 [Sinomonas atrocyanea]